MVERTADPPVAVGDILADKYRVERIIGVGGMGVVVAATHMDLREMRAIKFMHPQAGGGGSAVKRFMREARAAARLKSEHVAKVHDIGRMDDGTPYIVMEYLEGDDLKALLNDHGVLSVEQAVNYIMQALAALAEAHAIGIVHRDLKPANLFIAKGTDGLPCVKVVDFGVSKLTGMAVSMTDDLTSTSALLGSPHYMSPEQLDGTYDVTTLTDIWSLGIILYEVLVGVKPFEAPSLTALAIAVIDQHPGVPSELNGELPKKLDDVILRCLAKDPTRRYRTVVELAEALAPLGSERAQALMLRIKRIHGAVSQQDVQDPRDQCIQRDSDAPEIAARALSEPPEPDSAPTRQVRVTHKELDLEQDGPISQPTRKLQVLHADKDEEPAASDDAGDESLDEPKAPAFVDDTGAGVSTTLADDLSRSPWLESDDDEASDGGGSRSGTFALVAVLAVAAVIAIVLVSRSDDATGPATRTTGPARSASHTRKPAASGAASATSAATASSAVTHAATTASTAVTTSASSPATSSAAPTRVQPDLTRPTATRPTGDPYRDEPPPRPTTTSDVYDQPPLSTDPYD